MPMSSSVLVNRTDVLDLLSQLETAMRADTSGSAAAAADVDPRVGRAKAQGGQEIPSGRADQSDVLEDAEIVGAARGRAAELMAAAEQEAAELRATTDDYVDGRLASLEISLTKTLEAVTKGREQLRGRSLFAALQLTEDDDLEAIELDLGGAKPGR